MAEASVTGEKKNAYRVLVGKHEGKKPLGRPRLRSRIILKTVSKLKLWRA
jgi:hypothetical protein